MIQSNLLVDVTVLRGNLEEAISIICPLSKLPNRTKPSGSTISTLQNSHGNNTYISTQSCCYPTSLNTLDDKFTSQYFKNQRKVTTPRPWSGKEEEEWQLIRSKLVNKGSESCAVQWIYTVLNEVDGFYLRYLLSYLMDQQDGVNMEASFFPFVAPSESMPRVLLLCDSITMGISNATRHIVRLEGLQLSVQSPPTNCAGFSSYRSHLSSWLGNCTLDLVQFNIGMHYHKSNMTDYVNELTMVVEEIRKHSPAAHIVFALTTPSPFDSNATRPNSTTCVNFNKFHQLGFVHKLNAEARKSLSEMDVTINDRYSVVHPVLEQYQKPCDVHFTPEGSLIMARHDLEVFARILHFKRV